VESAASFDSFTSLSRELRESGRVDPETHPEFVVNQGVPGGTAVGICLHTILEQVPLDGALAAADSDDWLRSAGVAKAVKKALAENGLSDSLRRGIANLAFQTLRSVLILPGGNGQVDVTEIKHFARELPFLMQRAGTPDYLEGSIDLLFEWEDRTYFVDWKSNLLPDYATEFCAETLRSEYSLQFAIYALAVCAFLGIRDEEAYEARFGGGLYAFLRGMPEAGQVCGRPSWNDLKTWEKALQEGKEESIHVHL
jgi:ATP-dependent exoDNAse (exonuclease V) beta subunit